ncbi:MAG TPA: VWA domain-containing protein [Candidatus Sulfotelmatobacter sp.]
MKHFLVPILVSGSLLALAQSSQPVSGVIKGRTLPITMCILIDNSGSMRDKRAGVMTAALALVRASKPHDEIGIVDFDDEAFNGLPHGEKFTSEIKEMEEALTHIDSRGGSAMRDASRMSIDQVEQTAHNDRKVLVLVTDGNDTCSTTTPEQLLHKVKNSGVRVYAIGLLNEDDPGQAAAARLGLERLADASGGLAYYPKNLAEVGSISQEIANEVRKQ